MTRCLQLQQAVDMPQLHKALTRSGSRGKATHLPPFCHKNAVLLPSGPVEELCAFDHCCFNTSRIQGCVSGGHRVMATLGVQILH